MRALILAAAMLAAPAMAGEMVYKNGGGLTVRLHESACDVPALSLSLGAESQTPARKATVISSGHAVQACWGISGDKVLIGDVLGHAGYIMVGEFRADPGV